MICTTTTGKTCKAFKIDKRQVCLEYIGRNRIPEALSLCNSKQGRLPLPTNQKENDDYLKAFISMLKKLGKTINTHVPLDANDVGYEGKFTTSTGEPVEWFNWGKNQPDNYDNEKFVHMYVQENSAEPGKWNDIDGNYANDVFCKYDL